MRYSKGSQLLLIIQFHEDFVCRFRNVHKNDEVMSKLKYVLDIFQRPMLELWLVMMQQLNSLASQPASPAVKPALEAVLSALLLLARMFYSLNWQDLPEYFEDHMSEWFGCECDALILNTLASGSPHPSVSGRAHPASLPPAPVLRPSAAGRRR